MPLADEKTLIRHCQEGDLRAYEALYRTYEKPMLSLAFRMLVTQEGDAYFIAHEEAVGWIG